MSFRKIARFGLALLVPVFVSAFLLLQTGDTAYADCAKVETSVINCDAKQNGIASLVLIAINFLSVGVGIAVVGGIVWGGFVYTQANGNSSKAQEGISIIINAVIGLVLYIGMYGLLQFLIPGGFLSGINDLPEASPPPTAKLPSNQSKPTTPPKKTASTNVCYSVTKQKGSAIEHPMYHGENYATSNSPAGIKKAAKGNFKSIDLDTQVTKDGVVVVTHWDKPLLRDGFYDPQGKISKNTTVRNMTFEQVSRLRNRDGASRIYSLEYMAGVLADNDMNLSLEVKTPKAFEKQISDVTDILNKNKIKAIIKGITSFSGMNETLKTAREHGFWTRQVGTNNWSAPQSCKS